MPRPPIRRLTQPAVAASSPPLVVITARSAAAGCVLASLLAALAPAAPGRGVGGRRPPGPAPVAYVANLLSGTVSRITPGYGPAPSGPVRLGRRSGPWAIAVAPDGRTICVASIGRGTVTPVSTRTGRPGQPDQGPAAARGLAVAPDGKTVWVVSQIDGNNQALGRVTPISTATGRAGRSDPGRHRSWPARHLARQPDRLPGHGGPQQPDPARQPDRDQRRG